MTKKLYKSATDKKICGVCAGIGSYLGIDSTVIRLAWLLLAMTGSGILLYFIAAIIMPEEPLDGFTAPHSDTSNFN